VSALVVEEVDAELLIDLRHRVLRAGRPRETAHLPGDDDPGTRHFRLAREGQTVAIASVMAAGWPAGPDGPAHQLRGMAVDPALARQGLGSRLLVAIQARYPALWCNARAHAMPFYARHGWTAVGEPFDVPHIGPHFRMRWSASAGEAEQEEQG